MNPATIDWYMDYGISIIYSTTLSYRFGYNPKATFASLIASDIAMWVYRSFAPELNDQGLGLLGVAYIAGRIVGKKIDPNHSQLTAMTLKIAGELLATIRINTASSQERLIERLYIRPKEVSE